MSVRVHLSLPLMNTGRQVGPVTRWLHTKCVFSTHGIYIYTCILRKKFQQNFVSSRDGPEKYRNKAEMKERRKTSLLRNNGRKERQEDNPTPDATGVGVFLSFFSTIIPQ